MAHTNNTENYNLPQWIGSDKPTFLGDFNTAFAGIDTQMKANADGIVVADDKAENATTLANDAQSDVDALTTRVTTAEGNISANSDRISVHDTDLSNIAASITTINTTLNNKQNTITGAASTVTSNNLTASRVLVSDSDGKISNSSISETKVGYLSNVTSDIQAQINNKASNNWTLMLDERVPDNTTDYTVPSLSSYKEFCVIFRHSDYAVDSETMPYTALVNFGGIWFGDNGENTIVLHPNNTTIRINGNVTLGANGYRILIYVR